ncbi:hypothetical protein [Lysobacter enzymogenes]|uniref:Lipoprotein n=2 Tax=root TaxID=1 RepID=A0AAU9AM70_LYSEN|nr:hypothetical protein [Lysobacter enzymogenes]BAV98404.1 conserved hypothetical protein [Lysobacter enzymogenes]
MLRPIIACFALAALAGAAGAATPQPPASSAPQPPSASPTQAQDIAFDHVRGCWIRREEPDGRATALLRLLPPPEHPGWLNGQISRPEGDDPDRRLHLWFSRDGRTAVLASQPLADPTRAPAGGKPETQIRPLAKTYPPGRAPGSSQSLVLMPQPRIEFVRVPTVTALTADWPADAFNADYVAGAAATGTRRLRVQASPERLTLTLLAGSGQARDLTLFDGRRDGCD